MLFRSPFTIKTPVSDSPSSVKGNTRIVLTDVEYSCNGKELELHTMGRYKGNIIFQNDCYCVTDINEIKEKKEKLPQMVIYYAVKGDKVWDIAKKYAASPDTLIKNNNLQGDELTLSLIHISLSEDNDITGILCWEYRIPHQH